MYDTSDIRKGLKVLMDGNPYTVIEFQFVKPGKGAAFTRTKMKNLLTGAVLERNLRSGDKLEPADVETKKMQYLYADADSFVFMDTTTYDQVNIPKQTVGDSADYMPENINVDVSMKTNPSASAYRYCIVLVSTSAGSSLSPERRLRSSTAPVSRFFIFVRVNAAPLPGLTNWNSMTV